MFSTICVFKNGDLKKREFEERMKGVTLIQLQDAFFASAIMHHLTLLRDIFYEHYFLIT
jgi:hypothetical protein